MSELDDINSLQILIRLIMVMSKISRLSYLADKAKQRYPGIESMTEEEMKSLTRMYLALGFDFEEAYKDWKKFYKDYKKNEKDTK